MCLTRVTCVSYWTRVPAFGWWGPCSGVPFLQFDGCCVEIALDWIVATNLSTLPHLPTVVVVVFLTIARRCRGPQLACLPSLLQTCRAVLAVLETQ